MQNLTLARRYASAVFRLAQQDGDTARTGRDLRSLATTIFESDDLRRFYLSPVFERRKKEDALTAAFAKKDVDGIAFHTMLLLVRKNREALLPAIADDYDRLALEASGKAPLEIVSAHELERTEVDAIVKRLEAAHHTAFDVTYRTDPSLIGGMRITMGDRRVDASLAGRLDEIARDLLAPAAAI